MKSPHIKINPQKVNLKLTILFMKRIFLGIIFTFSFTAFTVTAQTTSPQQIEQSILKSDIAFDVYFLASDEFLGRDTGTQELKIASSYIANRFQQYGMKSAPGLDGYYQNVPFRMSRAPEAVQMSVLDSTFTMGRHLLSLSPFRGNKEAEVVVLEFASEEEIAEHDLQGKIVIAKAGLPGIESPQQLFQASPQKRSQITEAGGLGLVELYENPQLPWQTLAGFLNRDQLSLDENSEQAEESDESSIPHFWMNATQGDINTFLNSIGGETVSLSDSSP